MTACTITTIAERPDLAPVVARWLWDAHWPGDLVQWQRISALVSGAQSRLGPPQCHVLLVDGVPAATASLAASDLAERPALTPWLARVFVQPAWRGHGLTRPLLTAIDQAARAAGIPALWLYTNTAEQLYERAGWKAIERIDRQAKRPVVLMRKLLQ